MSQKMILATALELAQKAVQLDSDNDVVAALLAYREACEMLSQVLNHENVKHDRRKLNQIYETYADRIRLLEALHADDIVDFESNDMGVQYEFLAEPAWNQTSPVESNLNYQLPDRRVSEQRRPSLLGLQVDTGIARAGRSVPMVMETVSKLGPETHRVSVRERRAMTLGSRERMPPTFHSPPLTILTPLQTTSGHAGQRRTSQTPRKLSDSSLSLQRRPRQNSQGMSVAMSARDAELFNPLAISNHINNKSSPQSFSMDVSTFGQDQNFHINGQQTVGTEPEESRSPSIATARTSASAKSLRSRMPKDPLSRPYWMMRLLLNTFASSRTIGNGTYITDCLFFPRDLWTVKNVKLRGEEEKIQAYQLIVHELQQLGRVDKNDIHSLFNSLDSLEKVIMQAHNILAKKLGSEVVESLTLPALERPTAPVKKSTGISLSKLLKSTTISGGREGETPASLSRDFEGEHIVLQRTTFQLFGLAQLLEQINLNLNTELLSVKDQLRLDQTYNKAADFFSRVVVKLYLADASQLLHCRLLNSMPVT